MNNKTSLDEKSQAIIKTRQNIINEAKNYIDKAQQNLQNSRYYINEQIALKSINFITLLRHTKGKFAGINFQLLPFQIKFLIDVLATYDKTTQNRRYKTAMLFIPRKNGKTEFIAALLNYFLFVDDEKGKSIYCAANETEQAKIVFDAAQIIVSQNQTLSINSTIFKSTKTIEKKTIFKDFIKVLTANAETKDGLNPYIYVYDELHAAKNDNLWQVLEEGQVSRSNPLAIIISTAGHNKQGIMKQKYDYAKQVEEGIVDDESFYSMIYEANEQKWQDEREWLRANPAIGYGVQLENLRSRFLKTINNASEEVSFKTKHLNIWCNSAKAWINDSVWCACRGEVKKDIEFYAGLDLSSVEDITAYVLFGQSGDKNYIVPFYWIPEENARARSKRHRVPYVDWINKGFIKSTPGNVVDYDFIQRDILEINTKFKIKTTGYDRWNSTGIITNLTNEGLDLTPYGQGFASMSAPTKEIYSMVLQKSLIHNNCPVMRWMISNVVLRMDSAGNVKPDKEKSREKIDGAVAMVMACGTKLLLSKNTPTPSPYESRGIRAI